MLEIIKRSKMENLIINVMVIMLVMVTIILNSNIYKQIFTESNLIKNEETLNKVIKDEKRFVTLDLSNAKLLRLSIKDNNIDNIVVNTYKITYNNETLIIFLNENTAVTDKIKGELIKPNNEKLEIHRELKKELTNENVLDTCFSNVNYKEEKKIITIKFLASIIFIAILIISSFLDIYYFKNPKKTRRYKKYKKRHDALKNSPEIKEEKPKKKKVLKRKKKISKKEGQTK